MMSRFASLFFFAGLTFATGIALAQETTPEPAAPAATAAPAETAAPTAAPAPEADVEDEEDAEDSADAADADMADTPVNADYRANPDWLPKADPEKGLVIIFREKRFVGSAVSFKFFYDGTKFPKLKNGSFVYAYLTPGDHQLYADKRKQSDARILAVEPGEVYYFEASIVMGMWKSSMDLLATDADVALEKLATLRKPELTPAQP